MEDIFAKIGLNQRISVGVSVSSNNLVEMICIDKVSRSIVKYAARELKYNSAIREIIDYEEFSIALLSLFKELDLNPKMCNVVLNIPNVHFGFINLPLILPDEQVSTAIASEVEQLYLFKRHEPVISWNSVEQHKDTDKHYVVYTAIQETVLDNLKDAFEELGAKLIAVENSYSSIFKGIQYSRIIDEEISNNTPMNVLLISPNNYAIFCLNGNKVIDYFEEPLAIKSFTNEEVYLAISSAASNALSNYPTQNLLLVSETDEVSAELLADKLTFDGQVKYLDCNKFSEKPFIEVSFNVLQNYIPMISLEAVGAATYNYEIYPIKFNFLSTSGGAVVPQALTISMFGKEIEIDRKAILTIVAAVLIGLAVVFTLIGVIANVLNNKAKEELISLTKEQQTLEAKIKESNMADDVGDIYSVTQQIYGENKKSLALFNSISVEIPKEVWLESYYTNSDGEVYISGKATSSEYIYPFFKGLKAANPDLFLSKLELDSNSPLSLTAATGLYNFEITSTKNKGGLTTPGAENKDGTVSTDKANLPGGPLGGFKFSPLTPPGPTTPISPPVSPTTPTPPASTPAPGAPPPITSAP